MATQTILYLMSSFFYLGFIPGMCKASSQHIARRNDISKDGSNTRRERFFLRKRNTFDRVADETPKQGSFKIDDGKAIGKQ